MERRMPPRSNTGVIGMGRAPRPQAIPPWQGDLHVDAVMDRKIPRHSTIPPWQGDLQVDTVMDCKIPRYSSIGAAKGRAEAPRPPAASFPPSPPPRPRPEAQRSAAAEAQRESQAFNRGAPASKPRSRSPAYRAKRARLVGLAYEQLVAEVKATDRTAWHSFAAQALGKYNPAEYPPSVLISFLLGEDLSSETLMEGLYDIGLDELVVRVKIARKRGSTPLNGRGGKDPARYNAKELISYLLKEAPLLPPPPENLLRRSLPSEPVTDAAPDKDAAPDNDAAPDEDAALDMDAAPDKDLALEDLEQQPGASAPSDDLEQQPWASAPTDEDDTVEESMWTTATAEEPAWNYHEKKVDGERHDTRRERQKGFKKAGYR